MANFYQWEVVGGCSFLLHRTQEPLHVEGVRCLQFFGFLEWRDGKRRPPSGRDKGSSSYNHVRNYMVMHHLLLGGTQCSVCGPWVNRIYDIRNVNARYKYLKLAQGSLCSRYGYLCSSGAELYEEAADWGWSTYLDERFGVHSSSAPRGGRSGNSIKRMYLYWP